MKQLDVVENIHFGYQDGGCGWALHVTVKILTGGFFTYIKPDQFDTVFDSNETPPNNIKYLIGKAVVVETKNDINKILKFK